MNWINLQKHHKYTEYHICLLHTRAVHDRFYDVFTCTRTNDTHKKKNDDGYYRTIAKAAAAPALKAPENTRRYHLNIHNIRNNDVVYDRYFHYQFSSRISTEFTLITSRSNHTWVQSISEIILRGFPCNLPSKI